MSKTNSDTQEKLAQVEATLHQLKIDYEKIEKEIHEKTGDLIKSNKLLQEEIIERKRIEAEILEISQEEQRRFGQQLHDGLCQELTAISVFAKSLALKMEKNKSLELAELKKISDMLLNAVDQARDTARGLYPGELEGASLMHSLEALASQAKNISFYCPEPILINDNQIATHLYRIAQEGISNAIEHGKAHHIEVSFTQSEETITLAIKDDGIGMINNDGDDDDGDDGGDDGGFKKIKGIGLKIMKYRAHIINASFEVKPNMPQGVILECRFKIPKNGMPKTERRIP